MKNLQESNDALRAELDEAEESISELLAAIADRDKALDSMTSYVDTLVEERYDPT